MSIDRTQKRNMDTLNRSDSDREAEITPSLLRRIVPNLDNADDQVLFRRSTTYSRGTAAGALSFTG
jgi:hypothetical protein